MAPERPTTRLHRSTWRSVTAWSRRESAAIASRSHRHSTGSAASFRRLPLFPVHSIGGEGTLAPVYVPAAFSAAGRGLMPLPAETNGRAVGLNLPLWALAALFAAFSLIWWTTVGALQPASPPSFVAIADRAAAVVHAVRSTAAAFPQAKSVVLARLRPGTPAEWLLVEVDGKALRAPSSAAGVEAALAAASVRLDDGDRVLVLPNEGASLASAARPGAAPRERVIVQRAVPFSVIDAGVPYAGRAAALTVGDALRAAGIDVDTADLVQPPTETPLAPGLRVAILRAQPVSIVAPDLQLEGRSRAGTVGDLLAEWNVSLGPLDRVEPPADAAVPAGGAVRVVRVREEEQKEMQLLPFRTETRFDNGVIPGARVRLRAGIAGLVERVVKVVYEDDAEVQRLVASEAVLRQAVDEIVLVGPTVIPIVSVPALPLPVSVPSSLPSGLNVRRVLTMDATGYDPGPASTGKRPGDPGYGVTASGMSAGYGVVAVDPRVIPFYTRLYIPGYGYAVAADTGSAIVGNRIDLGFATYGEAMQWGRRSVPVYVLDPS